MSGEHSMTQITLLYAGNSHSIGGQLYFNNNNNIDGNL